LIRGAGHAFSGDLDDPRGAGKQKIRRVEDRRIYTIENEHEFGFAYGTLSNHAESGEEIFQVSLDPESGRVSYLIRATSRPHAPMARLGSPIARSLQARFRRDSAAAMTRALDQ
jgi:uncharacterized protein (UPF0548 family)